MDPVAGYEEEWNSSDSEEEEEGSEQTTSGKRDGASEKMGMEEGKWVQREVELVDSTREVGFWIEGGEARVRVELRARA